MGVQQGEGKIQEYQSLPFLFCLVANWCVRISQRLCNFEPAGGGNAALSHPQQEFGEGDQTLLILFME